MQDEYYGKVVIISNDLSEKLSNISEEELDIFCDHISSSIEKSMDKIKNDLFQQYFS
jgi:hypothetical protein